MIEFDTPALEVQIGLFSVSDDGRTKPVPRKGHSESFEPADNKCLIRASDGKKKISTVVGGACVELTRRLFGLSMPKFDSFLFQVSTKEVIKFQMVSLLPSLDLSLRSLWFLSVTRDC